MTKDKMFVYHPSCYGISQDDEYMTWLSHWKFGSHEVGPGDEINISIFDRGSFEVKEIGAYLVYEEQEAGVHLAKRQKVIQTCEKSQYVIGKKVPPWLLHGKTRVYSIGYVVNPIDKWLERCIKNCVSGDISKPSGSDKERGWFQMYSEGFD